MGSDDVAVEAVEMVVDGALLSLLALYLPCDVWSVVVGRYVVNTDMFDHWEGHTPYMHIIRI